MGQSRQRPAAGRLGQGGAAGHRRRGDIDRLGGEDVRDQQALLRHIVDAHYDAVWRVLRRLGVPSHEADDAAQRVFARVLAPIAVDSAQVPVVVDIREGAGLMGFPSLYAKIRRRIPTTLVFLEADDQTLARRFSETRRPHPLAARPFRFLGRSRRRHRLDRAAQDHF